jgi:methyl-accepting chemotaxis protein
MAGQIGIKENEMAASLAVIRSQYLGNPDDVKRLSDRLAEWKVVRDQNIHYCQNGEFDKAAVNSRQFGLPQLMGLRRELAGIYAFAQDKAAEFNRRITERRDAALRDIALTLAGLLLLGAFLARLITRSIVVPLGQLRDTMHLLADGDLTVAIPNHSRVA